ncbi:hypothetical protein NPIL_516101 [Nephila pilipes]|uniref:C2H2-type domain-containing protein n=1 Tax=Nephila pilipes TaxID=299642 RepID=A0A8X6T562_NEPPI|nr:hypothetical protein NPIL_516101 [Nephila pilipes]
MLSNLTNSDVQTVCPDVKAQDSTSSSTKNSSQNLLKLFGDISLTGPPTVVSFSKPTYAQKVRFTLERCPFCEKKFYTKTACDQHFQKIHNPKSILPQNKNKLSPMLGKGANQNSPPLEVSSPTHNKRKIIQKFDYILPKPKKASLFPPVSRYNFFCHICVDYFQTNLTKAQHYKISHNISLKNISNKPCTKEIQISKSSPPHSFRASTSLNKEKIPVPHVQDHQAVYIPVTHLLLN